MKEFFKSLPYAMKKHLLLRSVLGLLFLILFIPKKICFISIWEEMKVFIFKYIKGGETTRFSKGSTVFGTNSRR